MLAISLAIWRYFRQQMPVWKCWLCCWRWVFRDTVCPGFPPVCPGFPPGNSDGDGWRAKMPHLKPPSSERARHMDDGNETTLTANVRSKAGRNLKGSHTKLEIPNATVPTVDETVAGHSSCHRPISTWLTVMVRFIQHLHKKTQQVVVDKHKSNETNVNIRQPAAREYVLFGAGHILLPLWRIGLYRTNM